MSAWPRKPLGDICTINPRLPKVHELTDEQLVSFIPMAAIDETAGSIANQQSRPFREVRKGYTSFREGDVLFAKITPCMENGKAAIAKDLIGGCGFGSTEFHVLRPGSEVMAEWLFYFIRQPEFRAQAKLNFSGTAGQQRVPTTFMSAAAIPLPPLPEQRRIVDILSRAEGIVRLRREAEKKAAELIPALFIEMFGDPEINTRSWPVKPIGQLGIVQLGRQRAPKYQTGKFTRPYVRVANVFEDRIDTSDILEMDFDARDYEQYRLEYGDILLNEGQSIELVGRPAIWRNEVENCCFQNTLVRFKANRNLLDPEFVLSVLLFYFRYGVLSRISSKTSNVAHLGASRFAKLPLICPPLDLQRQFAQRVEAIRALQTQQAAATAKAQASFDALLAQAFPA